jgi:hypothetical protein
MKEIAAGLGISRRTVESHKYQLMATLDAHSTADLVRHALRLGLIDLGDGPRAGAGARPGRFGPARASAKGRRGSAPDAAEGSAVRLAG